LAQIDARKALFMEKITVLLGQLINLQCEGFPPLKHEFWAQTAEVNLHRINQYFSKFFIFAIYGESRV
jgi:hypothetical protein